MSARMAAPPLPLRLGILQQPVWVLLLLTVIAFGVVTDTVEAQTITDPTEASALNAMFSRWGKSSDITWNISGELCTGVAIDATRINDINPGIKSSAINAIFSRWNIAADNTWNISGELCSGVAVDATEITNINPGIKCECRNNTCRITRLRANYRSIEGPLPDELWTLTSLMDLNLVQNLFNGPIPAAIANLSQMQYLSFGINELSGDLPTELGQLTELRSLSFSTNNFSGPLPSSIGNLPNLEQLYIDSSGVSGPIPSTFANLTSLQVVWASDNALSGQIPEFIGSWSGLRQLRLQGNSFDGPIPSSFIGLRSLTDLRISELSNSSSSLDFLANMSSLSNLILRNNNISGTIPSFLGGFQSLTLLDLSFNNLTGSIPDSLFNIGKLTGLILGSNVLTGALPTQNISPNLQNIDLSYNNLSGSFPSWITQRNLQLNFVANNFTVNNSDISGLPSGLNCLQNNFPCRRGDPIYSSFAVKCGGLQIRGNDQTTYESDNETLGPATYYVTNQRRWGVSNVGVPIDNNAPQFQSSSQSQFTNTLDSELFRTARISAGSLRYYGLGLENGNYTVTLQFAESEILNTRSWERVGRRVFDIYIQGNRVERDFDIQREAGGTSLRAVRRNFTASVRDNYIEVHLFWAGKGTCCVPRQGLYGPSISAISAVPDFIPTVFGPAGGSNNRTGLIAGVVVGVGVLSLLALSAFCYVFQKKKKQRKFEDEELLGIDARPYTYSYAELKSATNDFNQANKLGEGGFGPVYKGTIGDGREVAVKQLSVASHQGKSQFVAEIATISAVQHKNLVKLYGCCIEGDKRLLVYEYLENKSLDQLLFGVGTSSLYLDWPMRYEICLGVARGLAYLHEESRVRIVHRDVKASNILLDADLTPKISDFGLAKLYDDKKTHISTRVAGTIGYLAPEYALRGQLTEKADVFGFGVVALEIISGRPNTDSTLDEDKTYLLELAWNLHESKRELRLVDHTLCEYNEVAVKRIINTALLCTQSSPVLRPPMSRVVSMLSGDIEADSVTSRPGYLTDWKFSDATTFMSEADISTPNTDTSHFNSSTSSTMITDSNASPMSTTRPMLHDW